LAHQRIRGRRPARSCGFTAQRSRGCRKGGGLSETDVGDVKLAVGEALANALKHGHQPGRDKIRLRCMSCDSALVVEVTDQGPGFDPDEIALPDHDELRVGGLGIHLMRSTMDEVEFLFDSEGSRVRMVKWKRNPDAL